MSKKSVELLKAEAVLNKPESRELPRDSDQIVLHCIGQNIVKALSEQADQFCRGSICNHETTKKMR